MKVHLLNIELEYPIARYQIGQLRGLINEKTERKHSLLHNHRDGQKDQYHYRYPLVQYKVVKGRAVVMGLNEGASLLRSLLDPELMTFAGDLPVTGYREESAPIEMSEKPKRYMLRQWLALNQTNYPTWQHNQNVPERKVELERILVAHLLSFSAGVGFTVPRPRGLELAIESWMPPRCVRCHEGKLLSFDVVFSANMILPPDVGIGKSASHGFGVTFPLPERKMPERFENQPFVSEKLFELT